MAPVLLQIMSDLHLETHPSYDGFTFAQTAPYLALLGDIGHVANDQLFSFLGTQLNRYSVVFFLLVNHEPYHISFKTGKSKILEYRGGLDVRAKDVDGNTPLHYLAGTLNVDEATVEMVRAMDGGMEVWESARNWCNVTPKEMLGGVKRIPEHHQDKIISNLTITVTGESSINHRPEQAVLFFNVNSDGPQQDTVSKEVTSTSNQLQQSFKELAPKTESNTPAPDASVLDFSASSLRSWSEIPRDRDGNPHPRSHHARVNLEATFSDFTKLGEIAGQLSARVNVEISHIDWRLNHDTKKDLGSKARKLAMTDAIQKAHDYAEVIGQEVKPVEIRDMGSSGPAMYAADCMAMAPMAGATDDERRDLDLTPQNIDFSCSVEVSFRGE